MIGSLADTLKGLFSRSFWFANFLPVLITVSFHALIFALAYPRLLSFERLIEFASGPVDAAGATMIFFLLLIILAYVCIPFVALFRGLLDGTLLPEWIHDQLRRERRGRWCALNARRRTLLVQLGAISDLADDVRSQLRKANAMGLGLARMDDPASIEGAALAVHQLKIDENPAAPGDRVRIEEVANRLAAALAVNTTNPKKAGANAGLARELEEAQGQFHLLLNEWEREAAYALDAFVRRYPEMDLKTWRATRLGDVRHSAERYSRDAYNISFEWLWPRLLLVLPESDTGITARLITATSQIDFAILLLFLSQSLPLVWLPTFYFSGGDPWLLLLVGWTSPLLSLFLYELVIRSQIASGGVVATAIDEHRFELLGHLHQPLPTTLAAERSLWERLARTSAPGNSEDLIYASGTGK